MYKNDAKFHSVRSLATYPKSWLVPRVSVMSAHPCIQAKQVIVVNIKQCRNWCDLHMKMNGICLTSICFIADMYSYFFLYILKVIWFWFYLVYCKEILWPLKFISVHFYLAGFLLQKFFWCLITEQVYFVYSFITIYRFTRLISVHTNSQ